MDAINILWQLGILSAVLIFGIKLKKKSLNLDAEMK